MQAIGAGIGHGGIVVFDDQVDLVERAGQPSNSARSSPGKCTLADWRDAGRRTVERDPTRWRLRGSIRLLDDLCDVMERASLCQLGGMTPIPVRSALRPAVAAFESDNEVQPMRFADHDLARQSGEASVW